MIDCARFVDDLATSPIKSPDSRDPQVFPVTLRMSPASCRARWTRRGVRLEGVVGDPADLGPATASVEHVTGAAGLGVEHQQRAASLAGRLLNRREEAPAEALP